MLRGFKSRQRYDLRFHLEEILTICMSFLLNSLIIVFSSFNKASVIFIINIGIILLIFSISYICLAYPCKRFSIVRDWYVVALLILIYIEHNHLVPLINPNDVDIYLIQIDRLIFNGNDPTILLERFTIPLITEFLQIIYSSFYFLPFTLCVLLYRQKSKANFHITASTIMLGFYISYIGYYITPAIGPRFTLDHLQSLPLTGIFTFDFLRNLLDSIEGITRDCCPSGHTIVSVLTLLLTYRYHKRFLPLALVWSCLMIVATMYLRYHYVTDIIAGLVLALLVYRYGTAVASYYITGREKDLYDMQSKEVSPIQRE